MAWPAIALGLGQMALQYWLGGQKQKRQSRLSPEAQQILDDLFAEYKSGEAPAGVTAPFHRQAKDIKQRFARRPGSSAKEHAILERKAYTPMAEAVKGYRESLQAQMAQILSGTGTQEIETGPDIGSILGEGIDDIAFALGLGRDTEDDEEETTAARGGRATATGGGMPQPDYKFGQGVQLGQVPSTLGGSLGKERWSKSSLRFRPTKTSGGLGGSLSGLLGKLDLSKIFTTLSGSPEKESWTRSSLRFRPRKRKSAFSFGSR